MIICRRIIRAALLHRIHVSQFTATYTNQTNINDPTFDPLHDFIETTKTQRIILGIGSSLAAIVNPRR